jgi:hypothetical protein
MSWATFWAIFFTKSSGHPGLVRPHLDWLVEGETDASSIPTTKGAFMTTRLIAHQSILQPILRTEFTTPQVV